MIISIVTTQASDKILHLFTIKKKKKTLNKLGVERNFLNLLKGLYQKPIADIIFNGKGVDEFPLRSRTGKDVLYSMVLEVLAKAIRQIKEMKGIQIGKEK